MIETYISIIASLFIIEILMSIDNALVNATIAESLPEHLRTKALRIGILLGAIFRVVALIFAAIIIQNMWLKIAGASYLIYLAMKHLGKVVTEEGHTVAPKSTFKEVVWQIALADIVFSIDNVVSAVSFSSNIGMVLFGVAVGVASMLYITPILSRLIHKYKGLSQAAYAIVGLVGVALLVETTTHAHIPELIKFGTVLAIVLFTVWYEHSAYLRKLSNPLLRSGQYILALPLDIFYAIIHITKKVAGKV